MNTKLARAVLIASVMSEAATFAGQPSPPPQNLPGPVQATIESRWLAPGVRVAGLQVPDGPSEFLVTWLTADGKVRRELKVSSPPGESYIYDAGEGRPVTAFAINGDWRIVLPRRDSSASLKACPDSRVFVHQYHPQPGRTASDVYVSGVLAGTLGPFTQYPLDDVTVGADGSVALLTWKDEQKGAPQVVVAGLDGKERFRADCDEAVASVEPAPDAAAALVQTNGGESHGNRFSLYSKAGKVSSLDVGANARFVTWAGATPTAIMETSVGDDRTWHAIDWQTGKRSWSIHDPNSARVTWAARPVAVTKEYLLIGGLEYLSYEDQKMPVRGIYALSVKDGRRMAHWLPSPAYQFSSDAGRFLRLGQRLFFMTDEAFCEIEPGDIEGHRSGWRE